MNETAMRCDKCKIYQALEKLYNSKMSRSMQFGRNFGDSYFSHFFDVHQTQDILNTNLELPTL